VAYEWRLALGGFAVTARTPDPQRADAAAIDGVLQHWQQVLQQIGYLDPAAPKKLLPRLRRFVQRAQPTSEEVHILRGIARAISAPKKH
jgi:tRNA/rRNA methyltransferase